MSLMAIHSWRFLIDIVNCDNIINNIDYDDGIDDGIDMNIDTCINDHVMLRGYGTNVVPANNDHGSDRDVVDSTWTSIGSSIATPWALVEQRVESIYRRRVVHGTYTGTLESELTYIPKGRK